MDIRNQVLSRFTGATLFAAGIVLTLLTSARGQIVLKSGDKVAFLGDSITAFGAQTPSGYVRLVASGLETSGVKITVIPAGVSGNTSKDEKARLDRDVISKKPDWVTISCGVNDVWHGASGVPFDQYKANMTDIVTRCKTAGIKVLILTSTPIGEDLSNANNQKLIAYNDFLRKLAQDQNCPLADLSAYMAAALEQRAAAAHPAGPLLTVDGVHMNPLGNQVMAMGILKGLGEDEPQIKQAHAAWMDVPAACIVQGQAGISIREYEQLDAVAGAQHKSVSEVLSQAMAKSIADLLSGKPDSGPATGPTTSPTATP